jgi:hypothetical protein
MCEIIKIMKYKTFGINLICCIEREFVNHRKPRATLFQIVIPIQTLTFTSGNNKVSPSFLVPRLPATCSLQSVMSNNYQII